MRERRLRAVQQRFFLLSTARKNVADALPAFGLARADVEAMIAGDDRLDAVGRLDVYNNMYYFRLLEVAEADFPKLRAVVGEAAFGHVVAAYLQAVPSRQPSVRAVFAGLPGFLGRPPRELRTQRWWRPWLADVAALEWARADVFDAADADVLRRDELAALPPEAFAGLRVQLIPAARLLPLAWPVEPLWRAIEAEETRASRRAPKARARHTTLVWRKDLRVFHRPLDADEAEALRALAAGTTFGLMCERAARRRRSPEEAARVAWGWLATFIDDALVCRATRRRA